MTTVDTMTDEVVVVDTTTTDLLDPLEMIILRAVVGLRMMIGLVVVQLVVRRGLIRTGLLGKLGIERGTDSGRVVH